MLHVFWGEPLLLYSWGFNFEIIVPFLRVSLGNGFRPMGIGFVTASLAGAARKSVHN